MQLGCIAFAEAEECLPASLSLLNAGIMALTLIGCNYATGSDAPIMKLKQIDMVELQFQAHRAGVERVRRH